MGTLGRGPRFPEKGNPRKRRSAVDGCSAWVFVGHLATEVKRMLGRRGCLGLGSGERQARSSRESVYFSEDRSNQFLLGQGKERHPQKHY